LSLARVFGLLLRGKVSPEGVIEVSPEVSAGSIVSDLEPMRPDSNRLQQPGKPVLCQRLSAPAVLRPRPRGDLAQVLDQFGGADPHGDLLVEDVPDIAEQKLEPRGFILAWGAVECCPTGTRGPGAAGRVGDGEQRAQVVSVAIEHPGRHRRIG
jgi:hypothetical protein